MAPRKPKKAQTSSSPPAEPVRKTRGKLSNRSPEKKSDSVTKSLSKCSQPRKGTRSQIKDQADATDKSNVNNSKTRSKQSNEVKPEKTSKASTKEIQTKPARSSRKAATSDKKLPPTRSRSATKPKQSEGPVQDDQVKVVIGARRKRKMEPDSQQVPAKTSRSRSCRATIDFKKSNNKLGNSKNENSETSNISKENTKGKANARKKDDTNKETMIQKTEKVPKKRSTGRNKKLEESTKSTEKKKVKDVNDKEEEARIPIKSNTTSKAKVEQSCQKNLTSKAILDLLSDIEDDASIKSIDKKSIQKENKKTNVKEKSLSTERSKKAKRISDNTNVTNNLEVSKNTSQLPIWKRINTFRDEDEFTGGDIYDPSAYRHEEEEEEKGKKKKARKRKKDTKAILVFGNKNKKVREVVKEMHNLKTPPVAKKHVNREVPLVRLEQRNDRHFPVEDFAPVPLPSGNPQAVLYVDSDVSCGAHNFFDTFQGASSVQVEDFTSTHTSNLLHVPVAAIQKNQPVLVKQIGNKERDQTTPVIPKNFAKRLLVQKDTISTPKLDIEKSEKSPVVETTKDMIKNAFGFDSEDSEDDMSCGESILSPVKKLPGGNSFFDASKHFDSRMSTTSFRDPEPAKTSMWRFDVERVSKPRAELYKQIHAMERERLEQGLVKLKNKRFSKGPAGSPKKKQRLLEEQVVQVPLAPELESILSIPEEGPADTYSVEAEMIEHHEEQEVQQPTRKSPRKGLSEKNAFEVLKSAQLEDQMPTKVKKLKKKLEKRPDLNESSLLEDKINRGTEVRKKILNKKSTNIAKKVAGGGVKSNTVIHHNSQQKGSTSATDKENSAEKISQTNNTLPVKTYSLNRTKNNLKHGVTFNQSMPTSPSKKPNKRDKKIATWAAHQTSHFSEIEDFDISFI